MPLDDLSMYDSSDEQEEEDDYLSSESEEYNDQCFYCSALIEEDMGGHAFYDTEPIEPRWYCSSCMLYIHASDIDSP